MPKKAARKTTKKVNKKDTKHYIATARIMGREFLGKGETIYEALGDIKTGNVVGRVVIMIECNDTSKSRIITTMQAKRMFNTIGLSREVALSQVSKLFSGVGE